MWFKKQKIKRYKYTAVIQLRNVIERIVVDSVYTIDHFSYNSTMLYDIDGNILFSSLNSEIIFIKTRDIKVIDE